MDLIQRARAFAIREHNAIGHKRKYSGEPYHVHLQEVAELVAMVVSDPEMIAAAWLHDIVEDTLVTIEEIRAKFGTTVARYVNDLTDVSTLDMGSRAERRAIDCMHTALASRQAKTIKLADLISNTRSIVQDDPKFAVVYLAEKRKLMEVLKEGAAVLYGYALHQLEEGEYTLERLAESTVQHAPAPTME